MFKNKYTLFQAFGIPVQADTSVLFLIVYLLYIYRDDPLTGLLVSVLLIFSIITHEFAHSLVAILFGGKVRDITLQLMGGCATITQMPVKPWQELLMAVAGPLWSFILSGIAFLFVLILPHSGPSLDLGHRILYILCGMNLVLGCFNLMPVFPMDGGRILRSALQMSGLTKIRATWIASRLARGIAVFWVVMLVAGFLGFTPQQPANLSLVASILWSIFFDGSIILLFIAWTIYRAADIEYRMAVAESSYQDFRCNQQSPPPPQYDAKNFPKPRAQQPEIVISDPPYGRDE